MAKVIADRLKRPSFLLVLLGLALLAPMGWQVLRGADLATPLTILARAASQATPAAAPQGPARSGTPAPLPRASTRPLLVLPSTLAVPRPESWPGLSDPAVSLPILPGATWRYFKGLTAAPPAAWKSVGFDDSTWLSGPSGFGYGDNDDATVLSDMQNAYTSVYIRKEFTIANPNAIGGVKLTIDYDDGYVAYINNAELTRSASMGGTAGVPPAYNATAASGHEASGGDSSPQPPDIVTIPSSALQAGTNVVAIEAHNQTIGSSDVSLKPTLEVLNSAPAAPTGASPANGQTGVTTNPQLCVTVSDPEGAPLDVTFHGREATGGAGDDFTVIAMPDTQYYSASFPATFQAQTQWIRDNRIARNIVMVTTLGDCVDNGGVQAQWTNASAAYAILENPVTTGLLDGIPFGVAVGNHDQDPNGFARISSDENTSTALFNQAFPKSRFSGRGYFGGQFPLPGFADSMDNHYELFSAGGMDFIAFHLEWDDTGCSWPANGVEPAAPLTTCQDVLKWMRTLLSGPFAGRRALVMTHFMGTPSSGGTGTLALSPQGQAILNAVKPLGNVFLMMGGHLDQADSRADLAADGHTINTLVSDYQTRPNGGDGWLRILTFHPQTNSIHVETYSPSLGRYINKLADGTPNSHADNLAPTENEVTLAYPMDSGAPFTALGTDTAVPSGSVACVTWPARQAATPYEWYAVVTDGVSTTTGARQTFTTTASCSSAAECNDGDPCTADTCNGSNQCVNAPIDGCCATAADCDDTNVCTDDACVAQQCSYTPHNGACSDGSACTAGDVCSAGVCTGGAPVNCNDGNACTADSCVPATGCTHVFAESEGCCVANANCDDGQATTLDTCVGGNCQHQVNPACSTNADCNDSSVCTSETCNGGGYSLALNGTTQSVTMGAAPGLGTADFTLEAWIKWNGLGTGAAASSGSNGISAVPVIAKGRGEADGSNLDCNYFLGIDANGRLAADFESIDPAVGGNNNYPAHGTAVVGANVWHHVAATYDAPPGSGCWDLYLDGVLVTDPSGRCPNTTPRYDSIQHFGLGTAMNSTGVTEGQFAGKIDEARVWNVSRTQAQIQASMSQVVETASGLIGHWGFDSGSTAADSTTPAENGTLVGTPAFDAADKPNLGAGLCQYTPLNCDDGNSCTADACDAVLGCQHTPVLDGTACDDGDLCTGDDACLAGSCEGTPNGVCCSQDSDCNDGNVCTANQCDESNTAALSFDGVNDTVDLGTAASITNLGTGSFTVEGWISTDGGNNDLTGVFRWGRQQAFPQVVLQLGGTGAPYRNIRASVETNQVSPTSQVDTPITAASLIPVNTWTHVALVADRTPGAQELRLYVNGDLASSASASLWGTNPISTTDSATLGAARLGDGTLGLFFDGRMDEFRMWSVARTEAQIESTMNTQVDAATPGLLARWGMNEGTGATTQESVSLANAVLNGAAWSTTDLVFFGQGLCQYPPLTGPSCEDGNACTVGDTCNAGACTAGGPRNCNDANGCTDDSCDDEAGCLHQNNAAPCSDGNACTTNDVCSEGACAGGALLSCDDNSACTTDACSPSTGCSHTAISCDDGNACTVDSCDPVQGCQHLAVTNGTSCSDGNACTSGDSCQSGVCAPGGPLSCDDGNVCTNDACNPSTGCTHVNNTASCSDGNACTTGDVCSGGVCSGAPLVCNDGDPCTSDTCVGGSCVFAPSASVCSDGVSCTTDVCSAGTAGSALQFNGSGTTPQFVGMGAQTARLGLARFTVEAWVKWDGGGTVTNTGTGGFATSGTGSTGGAIPIVARGRGEADGSNVDANYFLGLKGGVLVADFEEGVGGTGPLGVNHPICGSTVLDTVSWHHVAAAYDGTCWQLYVDGNPETLSTTCSSCAQTGACNICPGQPPRSDSVQHFGVGSALNSTGAPEGDFQGKIDEVRVWNYARSASEVATTRDKRLTQSFGLVGRWGLDENGGGTTADSSGGGATGTLTNVPTWVAGNPAFSTALCSNTTTAGCCLQASDCNDANTCTADSCNLGTHACVNAPSSGSCNDGNSCTTGDTCQAGVCTGTGIPNCCTTDAQCDDGSTCTADYCGISNVSALQFDGTNDYVTMGSVPGPTGLGLTTFTLEGWIKWTGGGATTSTGGDGLQAAIPLITKGRGEADGSNVDANYFFGIVNGKLAADYEQKNAITTPATPAGENRPICGTINVPVGSWAHVAVTYDGTWRLYVNGVEGTAANGTACAPCTASICSQSPGATPGVIPRDDSIQHFGLGTAMTSTGAAAGFFAGQMDEVRVWNRALSAADINAGMNRQLTSGTGLVGRWDLNQNAGTVATDSAAPAQNGSLMPGPSPDLPVWVTAGIPNFGNDTCAHAAANNGGACNDGSACTSGETCSGGVCGGGSTVSCDDNNPCTTDTCNAVGGCQHAPVICNDGNACTTDSCNPANGQCVFAPITCDDGNACNGVETCSAGACVAGTPVTCTALDACHVAGVCNPGTGICTNPAAPNGTTCSDGNACTQSDTCQAGTCTAGAPVVCTASDSCHDAGVCNTTTGVCSNPAKTDGSACSDGNACTTGETCQAGSCSAGTPVVCTALDSCHGAGTCDPQSGQCSNPAAPNGTSCSDNNACTQVDTCQAGTCTGANPVVCTPLDQCHTAGSCDPQNGQCSNPAKADGTTCSDGNACTQTDTCQAGTCTGGNPVVCTATDQCHVAGTCNPANGSCSNPQAPNGTTCNDGSACTSSDVCTGGTCSGAAVTCSDGNACNGVETCNPATGCVPGTPPVCDDGQFCNGVETCHPASGCVAGTPPNCNDLNGCTLDACDESADACTHAPTVCAADIGGTIRYYRDADQSLEPSSKPVGGIGVSLTGTGPSVPDSSTTGASGQYAFTGRQSGQSYTVSPSKSGDFLGAISSFDAALVARASVNLIALTPTQTLAGDTSGNGSATSFDAAQIAQFAAGLIPQLPAATAVGSDWFLVPTPSPANFQSTVAPNPSAGLNGSISYSPLVDTVAGQDFLAGLFGDVSGNWSNLASPLTGGGGLSLDGLRSLGLTRTSTGGRLTVAQVTGTPGRTFEVAISATGAEEALSFDLDLGFDASALTPLEVTVGDAARAFTLTPNLGDPGHVRISLFGPEPLGASGDLVKITFKMAGNSKKGSTLTLQGFADEGTLPVTMKAGRVRLGKVR
ncbi:MAG TPA: LamG-like jellyroll fold domain-containing protein [Candidatus Polarisedimenticolia bacterium]|nr:LamG-like jellyroll fold domain-containing protein [Candidatus Polarisedimenticolia bacterium]